MFGKLLWLFFVLSFGLISCVSVQSQKPTTDSAKEELDSNLTLKLKPLSTEKTHEGGVDKSKKLFDKK
jgi:hypothetical protein